jgi:nucleoside-diphosphate-sugar epimerase
VGELNLKVQDPEEHPPVVQSMVQERLDELGGEVDALRVRLDDQAAMLRRTHAVVTGLAESLGKVVASQRRRERGINLNSFVAYMLFTTRSFCYVDDLVDGILRMMDQTAHPGPVNLGNPEEHTIRHLAELVIERTGSRSKLVHRPLPADDPARRRPDITRAGAVLGWTPRVPLRQGLDATIAHFDALLRAGTLS